MKPAIVLLAAGSGNRFGHSINKVWLPLAGKSVICRSIENAHQAFPDSKLLLMINPDDESMARDIINKEISERTEQLEDEKDPAEMFQGIEIGEAGPEDEEGDYEDEEGENDPEDYDDEPHGSYDSSDDADALASAGFGSDEDYGHYGDDESFGIYDSYDFNTGQPIGESMKKSTKVN